MHNHGCLQQSGDTLWLHYAVNCDVNDDISLFCKLHITSVVCTTDLLILAALMIEIRAYLLI